MGKKISLLFQLFLFSYCTFSQTFRSGFDFYEFHDGGAGQGYSFYSNLKNELGSSESQYLETYITMFKATKDKRYLDKFIIHSKRVQERRDDNISNLISNFTNPVAGEPTNFGNCSVNNASFNQIQQNWPGSKGWSTLKRMELM